MPSEVSLPLVAGPMFGAAGKLMPRTRKPEWLLLAALVTFVTTVGVVRADTRLAQPADLLVIFYLVGVSSRFARRGAIVLSTLGVAVGAVVVADPVRVDHAIPTLVAIRAVAFLSSRYTQVLARTEFDHREAALLDPLTGLLNRTALESRFEELRQQAVQIGGPCAGRRVRSSSSTACVARSSSWSSRARSSPRPADVAERLRTSLATVMPAASRSPPRSA
jgi:hypothetical protein